MATLPFGEGSWIPNALLAAGALAITLPILARVRRRLRERAEEVSRPPRERVDDVRARAARESAEAVMVEIQEITRLCAAQIENRATRLEKLIAEADRKIRRLEELEERSEPAYAETPRYRPVPEPRQTSRAPRREAEAGPMDAGPALDSLSRRVHELADAGHLPVDIARKLDEQVGKIELILALRRG